MIGTAVEVMREAKDDWIGTRCGKIETWIKQKQQQESILQGGESRGLNDRVHGISFRYSDKTCKKINYILTNTYLIIMQ